MANILPKPMQYFLPDPALTQAFHADSKDHARVHVFIVLASIVTFIAFGYSVFLILLQLTLEDDFLYGIVAGLISTGLAIGILFYFKCTGKLWAATTMLSTTFLIACVASILISGGFRSPLLPLLTACPIMAAVIGGRDEGGYYTLIASVVVLMLIGVDRMGIDWLQVAPDTNEGVLFVTSWMSTLTINMGCLYTYLHFHER